MHLPVSRPRWYHPLVVRFAYSRAGRWLGPRMMHHLDRLVLSLTGRRHTISSLLTGTLVFLLTSTGAKSGQPRSVPVLGIVDGESVLLVASNWGQKSHPGWYYNLLAHPQATLALQGQEGRYCARALEGAEHEEAWRKATRVYPGYAVYQQTARNRKITIFRLEEIIS